MAGYKFYGNKDLRFNEKINSTALQDKNYYKRFKILTILAFALSAVVVLENMLLFAQKILFIDDMWTKVALLFIEIVILAFGIVLILAYRHIDPYLSYGKFGIIIAFELVFIIMQWVLCSNNVSVLYYVLVAIAIAFIIFVFKNFSSQFHIKGIVTTLLILLLVTLSFIYCRDIRFTPKSVYLSTNGYSGIYNDMQGYHYEKSISADNIDETAILVETMSNTRFKIGGMEDMDYLKGLFNSVFPFVEAIDKDNRYDEGFFGSNALYFSVVQLENLDDTVECVDLQCSYRYTRPVIDYYKSDPSYEDDDEKAICIIVYEIPLDEERIIDALNISGFTMDRAYVNYKH
ncbi:MAG TPA: hypothetical protein GX401_04545 [Clostridiales bacterium]|nr:hypothetical protein [Clostridiales bacterium]